MAHKGWKLISFYPQNREISNSDYHVSFTHYTGKPGKRGGSEYDKSLEGTVTIEQLRRVLKKFLTLRPEAPDG